MNNFKRSEFYVVSFCKYDEYKDFRPAEKPAEVIPKGYYKCVDCGKVCKRLNASQKRCADCQKIHAKELERAYDKKRRR